MEGRNRTICCFVSIELNIEPRHRLKPASGRNNVDEGSSSVIDMVIVPDAFMAGAP
ncbi:hypothetical protein SAMN05445850_8232 [Paraburkholderia tuberum]|uniref:Uncharacterized protein n=1 Tax=Paraburkholderia tuberum TaxID=157910 RepID=A0A1H1KKG7_9BURK|nr:hypothetical protein SAMN05445850_8232 [Paraburkholderia tuberum]